MIVCTIKDIVKEYDGEALTKPISFNVHDNDRIALIGPNGCGKSTLLKIVNKNLEADKGFVNIDNNITVGYLSQEIISSSSNTLREEAEEIFKEIKNLENAILKISEELGKDPHNVSLLSDYSKKEEQLHKLDGYNYQYKIDTVLRMFGFSKDDESRIISTFSGGEKLRVAFAKLLLIKPDILLLDEPTNHLDIITIEWLENYLKSYEGAIIFVSHDKNFIKALANKIVEIENKTPSFYNGNYDYYSKEKVLRYEQALEKFNRQQEEIAKLKKFIEFYMPKPRFVSRAHDREKKLARIEANKLDKPIEYKNKTHINLKGNTRKGKEILFVKDLAIGYPDSTIALIENINFNLYGQDHLFILGSNGSGKTTFIKTFLKKLKPLSGTFEEKFDLNIGYLEQDFVNIKSALTIFEYFRNLNSYRTDQEIYDHLAQFSFNYEDTHNKVIDKLSGGEQMRLVIAKLALDFYDILILDEPTNHLDMYAKAELVKALNSYDGTLIVISHDRDFIDQVSNKIIYFFQRKAFYYEGAYQEFKESILDKLLEDSKKEEANLQKEDKTKVQQNVVSKKKSYSIYTYEKTLNKIEKLENELKVKNDLLFNEEYYSNPNKLSELNSSIKSLEGEIKVLYAKLEEMES